MPRPKKITGGIAVKGSQQRDYRRVSLPPGSKLALRFPQFVKRNGEDDSQHCEQDDEDDNQPETGITAMQAAKKRRITAVIKELSVSGHGPNSRSTIG